MLASNTIPYCADWTTVVDFYRHDLGLRVTMDRDWFVEFELHPGAHLSIADASSATISARNGSGLTLSWRVDNIRAMHTRLTTRRVEVSTIRIR